MWNSKTPNKSVTRNFQCLCMFLNFSKLLCCYCIINCHYNGSKSLLFFLSWWWLETFFCYERRTDVCKQRFKNNCLLNLWYFSLINNHWKFWVTFKYWTKDALLSFPASWFSWVWCQDCYRFRRILFFWFNLKQKLRISVSYFDWRNQHWQSNAYRTNVNYSIEALEYLHFCLLFIPRLSDIIRVSAH